jgi:hypothetical protein
MARHPRGDSDADQARGHGRRVERDDAFVADSHERAGVAQVAARLIAEHGISDWSLAKRKAARQLGLPDRAALPGDDEVEAALLDYHAIFGGEAHREMLRGKREEALRWMRRLADFRPVLVGGVAGGWATEHSDVRIDLVTDDGKAVELLLINQGCEYRHAPSRHADDSMELWIDTRTTGVRLRVRTHREARQVPRRSRHGQEALRLDAAAVAALLDADAGAA